MASSVSTKNKLNFINHQLEQPKSITATLLSITSPPHIYILYANKQFYMLKCGSKIKITIKSTRKLSNENNLKKRSSHKNHNTFNQIILSDWTSTNLKWFSCSVIYLILFQNHISLFGSIYSQNYIWFTNALKMFEHEYKW